MPDPRPYETGSPLYHKPAPGTYFSRNAESPGTWPRHRRRELSTLAALERFPLHYCVFPAGPRCLSIRGRCGALTLRRSDRWTKKRCESEVRFSIFSYR